MLYKGFELAWCNSAGVVHQTIRRVELPYFVMDSVMPDRSGMSIPDGTAQGYIDGYTDDRGMVTPFTADPVSAVNARLHLQEVFSGLLDALIEPPPASPNNYLKLTAANGFYAVTKRAISSSLSTGALSTWNLYDENGTLRKDSSRALTIPRGYCTSAIGVTAQGNQFSEGDILYIYVFQTPNTSTATLSVNNYYSRAITQGEADWLNGISPYIPPSGPDPYTPGGEGDVDGPSGPGGGGGDHDTTSDPIAVPSLPTTSAVDTGFITLFNPSLSEIRALADYMWNGLFDINNLRKLFADPMDVILGLSIVPGPVPSGAQEAVSIGNISTGVMMTTASDQFFTVDCGTLKPTEFWGAYLDYSPYTKVDIYLPFIGMRSLSIDDVMEKNVNVVYHVDILSGACVAFIKSGDQVLYTHIGQCAASIPINGNDWTNTINGILSMAAAIAGTVATGGAAAPMLMGQAANITNILKPSVARSGGMGGMGGMLGIQKPYLILTRPRQCVPGNQNIYKGYPAFMTRALGDLSGMTSVEDIHLAVAGATQEELEEIERLLKEGVML